jgi:predicted MFS family arabinose efflux permease
MIVLVEMLLMNALTGKSLKKIISMGVLFFGSGFALMPLGRGFIYAAFTVVVWTMGEILSMPSLAALIVNHSDDAVRGKYMGMFSFAVALAVALGPSLGAVIYDSPGPNFLWFGCGGMGILLFLGFTSLKEKGS